MYKMNICQCIKLFVSVNISFKHFSGAAEEDPNEPDSDSEASLTHEQIAEEEIREYMEADYDWKEAEDIIRKRNLNRRRQEQGWVLYFCHTLGLLLTLEQTFLIAHSVLQDTYQNHLLSVIWLSIPPLLSLIPSTRQHCTLLFGHFTKDLLGCKVFHGLDHKSRKFCL